MDHPQKLLDTTQAAERVGLSSRTLDKFRRTGGGPVFIKLGRRALYDPEDLAAWIQARKRTSTKEGVGLNP